MKDFSSEGHSRFKMLAEYMVEMLLRLITIISFTSALVLGMLIFGEGHRPEPLAVHLAFAASTVLFLISLVMAVAKAIDYSSLVSEITNSRRSKHMSVDQSEDRRR